MKKLATGCYAVLLVLMAALPAVASQPAPPRYQSSEPSDGATVHQPPDRIEATFDQPLDDSSLLAVQDECGRRVDDGSTTVDGNSMTVGLSKKPSGEYHVAYKAVGLGGITGESTGHFTFTAHGGDPCNGGPGKHDHDDDDEKDHDDHKDDNSDRHKNGHGDDDHSTNPDHDRHDSDAGGTHNDHDASAGGTHGEDHGGNGGDHGAHGSSGDGKAQAAGGIPGISSPDDTTRKLLSRADSSTLLLSLGLCLLLGILGGAILRTSGVR